MQDGADLNFVAYLQSPDAQLASWEDLQHLSAATVRAAAGGCPPISVAGYVVLRAAIASHRLAVSGL
jgi:hypothetical protein